MSSGFADLRDTGQESENFVRRMMMHLKAQTEDSMATVLPLAIQAIVPSRAELVPVTPILANNVEATHAIVESIQFAMALCVDSRLTLLADPIDDADPPLTLYCRIPGDRETYVANRKALLDWWRHNFSNVHRTVLFMPLPDGPQNV